MESPQTKILVLTGTPGSGKNAMINAYGKTRNVKVVRFHDVKGSSVKEVSEVKRFHDKEEEPYPEDLENLIFFLRS